MCRVTVKWEDKRFIGKRKSGGNFDDETYNEHRQTECPSNHVPYEDVYTLQLWKPQLQVLNALEVVIMLICTLIICK